MPTFSELKLANELPTSKVFYCSFFTNEVSITNADFILFIVFLFLSTCFPFCSLLQVTVEREEEPLGRGMLEGGS